LVYDNSPEPQSIGSPHVPFGEISYVHDASNGGLAAAYNHALETAAQTDHAWLWLFDQDTAVSPELVAANFAALDGALPADVCAIVPRLLQDGIVYSPLASHRFHYVAVSTHFSGIYEGRLTALNSCACLRVSALRAIGGFPTQYWLDYLDHAVFHRLTEQANRVLVIDVTILHRLSTNNLREESGHRRYDNVLAAEWQFVRETGWGGGNLMHRLRLIKRAYRTLRTMREPRFALQVLKWALR
jgi:GT2 family glycosyltransferase